MPDIIKELKENTYFFTCNCCGSYLYNSLNINSLYVINDKEFAFMVNNKDILSLTIDTELNTKDDLLSQNDCAIYKVFCSSCKRHLGSKILLATEEKIFLCDHILIRNDMISSFKHTNFTLAQTKLKMSIQNMQNNPTVLAVTDIQNKIKNGVKILNNKLSAITKGRKLLDNITELKEEKEKLEKILDYLKYSSKMNKSIGNSK